MQSSPVVDIKRKKQVQKNFDLLQIKPKNSAQEQLMFAFHEGLHCVAKGSAGTGKSFVSLYLALTRLLKGDIEQIKIVRSAVPTRSVGFLSGSLTEKLEVYELPYIEMVNNLLKCGSGYETLKKKNQIEFLSTSYVRGLTFDNCVVIMDEFQSMNRHEILSLLTRCGENCQMMLCGDSKQNDLPSRESGFDYLVKLAEKIPNYIDVVHFTPQDIVRSAFVKALLIADEEIS